MTKPIDEVLARLQNVKRFTWGWTARCPAHDDQRNSLSLKVGDDERVLLKCHANPPCQFSQIAAAIDLPMNKFFSPQPFHASRSKKIEQQPKTEIVTIYDYHDASGQLLYQVCRTSDKQFPQRRPDGKGGWIWGMGNVEPVLYRLPQLLAAIKEGRTIYIVEGEKDVDRLFEAGLVATTNPMGAGKWRDTYTQSFQGCKNVVILPDNDPPGLAHAEMVASILYHKGITAKVIPLPDLSLHGDISDWLDHNETIEHLNRLVETSSIWTPAPVIKQSGQWSIYTLAEAYKPRPPLQYIVSDLFSLPSLSIVYGPPGTLKSLLLADMAICVSAGLPWLPPLPNAEGAAYNTLQSPAIWLDFDNGKRRTDERFEALARARDLPETTPLYYASMPAPWLDAGSSDSINALAGYIHDRGIKLAVIDNLGVITGKTDENASEMATVMRGLRWLAENTGAAIVLIHHQRKNNGMNSRAGDTLRGHSSIEASLDLALLVERDEHAEFVTVKSTKTRGVDVLPFMAQFVYEHKTKTTELAKARFLGLQVEDVVSDYAIEQKIIAVVSEKQPINKGEIVANLKKTLQNIGTNRIRDTIDRLCDFQKLNETLGLHGAKFYTISTYCIIK